MGRNVPNDNLSSLIHHPFLYFSFVLAGLAATIAIITSMCSLVSFRRKKPDTLSASVPLETLDPTSTTLNQDLNDPSQITETKDCKIEVAEEEEEIKELPLPPALQQPNKDPPSFPSPNKFKRATSERKTHSLSIKVKRTLSVAKNWDHHHHKEEKEKEKEKEKDNIKGKLKAEDSIWMKTIILGEKCNTDEVEDPIIYEGKGKRIAAYHPRNKSTMSSLDLDTDAFCIPQPKIIQQEDTKS